MLDAAAVGLGVAIAPEMLVQGDLQAGRLVAPLGFKETGGWFSLYFRVDAGAAVGDLSQWLKTAAGAAAI
ncbi:DNA-binding transcriptional activator GcvA [compost metagenome]